MPISARASEPTHFDAEDDGYLIQSDLRNQPLESRPTFRCRGRTPKVLVNHHNFLSRPTELNRFFHQTVLKARRFLMPTDLLKRRLPNIGDRLARDVASLDFVALFRSPRRRWG